LAESEKRGGRKKASIAQPGLKKALKSVVKNHTAGSPVAQGMLWTNRSPREISEELLQTGFSICEDTVRRMLSEELNLGVRQARKDEASRQYAFRNEQFEYLAEQRDWYLRKGWPVLSIDTKKKESLGNFFRAGTAYTNSLLKVWDHDFVSQATGQLVPYGIYDLARNEGFVLLSHGADTSEMVCDAIWRWWRVVGEKRYWHASGLLLLCDCGGSNGYRVLRFKEDLKNLAIRLLRPIQVAHYPPGCSKFNPIEHRMFCHITRSLSGVILKSMEVARQFIERTSTRTGLRVLVEMTEKLYAKARKATADFRAKRPIDFDAFLPQLNYKLSPYGY
jgi:hypothetical protein